MYTNQTRNLAASAFVSLTVLIVVSDGGTRSSSHYGWSFR